MAPRSSGLLPFVVVVLALTATSCEDLPRPLPSPSPRPARGGVFRFALTEPRGLDPALSEDAYQWLLIEQMFDGLVSMDPDLNVVPALAKTWTISPDGLTYRFTLRSDARFQNGRQVTASDVAWSFLRAARIPGGLAREYVGKIAGGAEASVGQAPAIAGVRVEGDLGLVITLAEPYAPFLGTLAIPQLRIVPREEVEARGAAFARHPVGTGAFEFKEWGADGRLVLTANETHWGGRPFLDRIEVHLGTWGEDALVPFFRGEVDMALIGSNDRGRLPAGATVVQRQELGMTVLGLNLGYPPMNDARIRRAAALSLDRDAIVVASGRIALPSRGLVPLGMAGGAPHAFAPERNLAEARRLVAEAGYPGGRGLPVLDLWANRESPLTQSAAVAVQRNLEEAGIRVREHSGTWAHFIETVDAKKAPGYLLTWVADTPDRDSFLGVLFHSKGANNYLNFADPDADRLLDAARRDMDPRARARLYRAVEEKVGEASVIIPLFSAANTYVLRPGLQGFSLDPMGLIDFSRLSWERPR